MRFKIIGSGITANQGFQGPVIKLNSELSTDKQ
jgi:hypothetical protein